MKLFKNAALGLVILLTSTILILGLTYNYMLMPINNKTTKTIEIKPGTSTINISKILVANKLIKNETIFRIYLKLNNINRLQAGYYKLSPNMGLKKIVSMLEQGDSINPNRVMITFKEGKNMRSVAKTIAAYTNNTEKEVFALLKDQTYIDSLIKKYWFLTTDIKNKDIYYTLEGYLFPNTYMLENKNTSVEDIFKMMLDQTNKQLEKYKDQLTNSKYTIHEYMTMASIVELEGVNNKDRASIAGVFYNRLNSNMSLGSDVTTYYAAKVDMSERDLYKKELTTYNPYNTRGPKMEGKLPIGPICNPGQVAIDAAFNPTNNNYYYFVADKNKKVYFTKNSSEHLKVIKEIKDRGDWITW
jgi:UPF0755 protein